MLAHTLIKVPYFDYCQIVVIQICKERNACEPFYDCFVGRRLEVFFSHDIFFGERRKVLYFVHFLFL